MATSNIIETAVLEAHKNNVTYDAAILALEKDTELMYNKTFPTVEVMQEAGEAFILTNSQNFNKTNALITPRSAPNEIGSEYKSVTFSTEEYALRYLVTDRDVHLFGNANKLTLLGTTEVVNALGFNMEHEFIEKFIDPNAKWATKFTGTNTASDYANGNVQFWNDAAADPLKDIREMVETNITSAGPIKMNRAMLSRDVWNAFLDNPDIYTRMQAKADDPKSEDALKFAFATLIGVEQVNIIDAVYARSNDKIRPVDGYKDYTPNLQWERKLKGTFAIYHYEDAQTLQTRAPGVVISVKDTDVPYNNGIPVFTVYRHADPGIKATWIDGRIRYGFHMSNPAGLILATNLLKTA